MTVDLPKCKFVHARFYNAETGATDKTHKDIAITFDIIDPPDFLENNGPAKFLFKSFALLRDKILSDGLNASSIYRPLDQGFEKSARVNDLVISSDKSMLTGQQIVPDPAFLNSLLGHSIGKDEKTKTDEKHKDAIAEANKTGVTGADLDASGKNLNESLEKLANKVSDALPGLHP